MIDVLYIAMLIAFFGLMVAFVHWCERIIGKDDAQSLPFDGIDEDEAADAAAGPDRTDRKEEVPA